MGYNRQNQGTFPQISDDILKKIITGADAVESAKLTVEYGGLLGSHLAEKIDNKDVSTSQIRAIFTSLRLIESRWIEGDPSKEADSLREFILLKSKLRYQAVRNDRKNDKRLNQFVDLLIKGIDLVQNTRQRKHFQRFVDFFEAVLAYHKAEGDKN